MNDVFLTPHELAAILNVSRTTVYRLIETRSIPFHRINHSIRFSTADVDEYLKRSNVDTSD